MDDDEDDEPIVRDVMDDVVVIDEEIEQVEIVVDVLPRIVVDDEEGREEMEVDEKDEIEQWIYVISLDY